MNNAKLAEDIKRLLPEERFKRIRQAIMLSNSAAAGRANDVRQELNDSQKIDKGVLIEGSVEFTSNVSATLKLWAWMIEFQVFQNETTTLAVDAPDPDFVRKDYFHANNENQIFYAAGILDAEGNSLLPSIPAGHIILVSVLRNPNGTNEDPEIPEPESLLTFTEDRVIPMTEGNKLVKSGITKSPDGRFVFDGKVKGLPAELPEEYVILSQVLTALNGKENSFTKNTAFNKNFGTVEGTVAQGNDSRINNGQTAFNWGNHASAGYALANGSNASGTWGINVSGTSASTNILTTAGSLLTQQGNGTLIHSYALGTSTVGLFPATDNSNSIITINRHPGDYYSQLGFSSDGNLYYRRFSAVAINNTQPWQTLWTTSNFNPANYVAKSGDTMTGVLTLAAVTTGTLMSRVGFNDFIGYNSTYGSYLGGGVGNATRYLYSGGFFFDGSGYRTLYHTGNLDPSTYVTLTGDQTISGLKYFNTRLHLLSNAPLFLGTTNGAYQRVDSRVDNTSFARSHWYGVTDSGATSNFRHAWYDGSSYINVTAASNTVAFSGNLQAPSFLGNASTASTFSTNRGNYMGITNDAVSGQLMWKAYGNNHTIFDASGGTTPSGTACSTTNSVNAWTGSYPTLMGWNGDSTYGVRVDSARISDNTVGNAATATIANNSNALGGISSNRVVMKRRTRIHSSDGTSLNSSIGAPEMGFTYGGSGEPIGPFIAFGGLVSDIDYSCQLVGGYNGGGNNFAIRTRNDDNSTWNPWRTIITDGNYTNYTIARTEVAETGASKIPRYASSGYLHVDNWIRLKNGTGLYSVDSAHYFYHNTSGYSGWESRSNSTGHSAIKLANSAATPFGYVYAESGNIGFTKPGSDGWLFRVDTSSNIHVGGAAFISGDFVAYSTSDIKFKENVSTIDNALHILDNIEGCRFTWKNNQTVYKGKDIGYIANEVQKVLPEVVETRLNGSLAMDYKKMTPVNTQAIKELHAKVKNRDLLIDQLIKRIEALESKLN